ncbi:sigma-70 family RNA polymerase sigma factor [Streptomyces sp. B6B3]|uniref:BACON domain-containing protein n=1 Tax=Streptomyces sp. B6B3 TaxID=3153570 RepID=UPI00325C9EE6
MKTRSRAARPPRRGGAPDAPPAAGAHGAAPSGTPHRDVPPPARSSTEPRRPAGTAHAGAPGEPTAGGAAPAGDGRSGAYQDAHLDGLFSYCLSIMCEHDAATAALGEALALAERQHERGRAPADPALARSWLYALARWSCLRRLAAGEGAGSGPAVPRASGEDAGRRRRELAALAWPEAAGTTHEQREALELAVRHQLAPPEVARVLRLSEDAARALLTDAAREVERTRGALAAVERGGCPAAAALSGDDRRLLLGSRLRGELVRHVDACPSCRLVAQRAIVSADWPGSPGAAAPAAALARGTAAPGAGSVAGAAGPRDGGGPARLAVLSAPRSAVHAARLAVRRARAQHTPRFDRAGFPLPDRDRAARRERLRSRAVTTTVVATVLAAPALALWAAYRAAPVTGDPLGPDTDGAALAVEDGGDALAPDDQDADGYLDAGTGETAEGGAAGEGQSGGTAGGDTESGGSGGSSGGDDTGAASGAGSGGGEAAGAGEAGASGGAATGSGGAGQPGAGRLVAQAEPTETGARITLTASGDAPVTWTAVSDADWLLLSRTSGTLLPGETAVVDVVVDREREPAGPWSGRITVAPANTVVTVEGTGASEQPDPDPSTPPAEQPTDPGPSPAAASGG